MKKITASITVVVLCFIFCGASFAQVNTNDSSLYTRLGGKERIAYYITEAVANMAGDRRINARLAMSDMRMIQKNWDSIICNKTGGNCTLPVFPKKFKATDIEWNAAIEDVTAALTKFKVKEKEKLELLEVIKALRKDFFN